MKLIKYALAIITSFAFCSCFIGGALYQSEIPILVPNLNVAPTSISISVESFYAKNVPIISVTPTQNGNGNLTFSVSPTLPSGLSMDPKTGTISGTPTETLTDQTYTLVVSNEKGSAETNFNLTIYKSHLIDSSGDADDANKGDGICDDGSGNCTLRAAIEENNNLNEIHVIRLPSYSGTEIRTFGDDFDITKDVIIQGDPDARAVFNGQDNTNIFQVTNSSAISLYNVEIKNLGALQSGLLTLDGDVVVDNVKIEAGPGYGVHVQNGGKSTIQNSEFTGATTVSALRLTGNGGPWLIKNCNIHDNALTNAGQSASVSIITNSSPSTIEGNSFYNNTNGGNASSSSVHIGFNNAIPTLFRNNTFTNDSVGDNSDAPVAFDFGGSGDFEFNTFLSNGNYAIAFNDGTARSNQLGNIFFNHSINNFKKISGANHTSLGYNVTDIGLQGKGVASDIPAATDLDFSALADNGGPTQTLAIGPNSDALISIPIANCPSTDQRGVARSGTSCNAGAYEAP